MRWSAGFPGSGDDGFRTLNPVRVAGCHGPDDPAASLGRVYRLAGVMCSVWLHVLGLCPLPPAGGLVPLGLVLCFRVCLGLVRVFRLGSFDRVSVWSFPVFVLVLCFGTPGRWAV